MEDIRTDSRTLLQGDYMCSLDLKNAFLFIPVAIESRKYFRFIFKGKLYQFITLPFGLSLSPFVVTKIVKPVISFLRFKGWQSKVYLDDFLFYGVTYIECIKNLEESIELLRKLGIIINYEKNCLTPSMRCKILGFVIDSNRYSLELTEEKRHRILKTIKSSSPEK